MVLLKIDTYGIAFLPFKRDPPGSVHGKSVARGFRVQRVKTPSWHTQIIERFCAMKRL